MDQLMEKIERVLSDHVEVAERNGVWSVSVSESGVTERFDFPTLEAADQFASSELDRLGRK